MAHGSIKIGRNGRMQVLYINSPTLLQESIERKTMFKNSNHSQTLDASSKHEKAWKRQEEGKCIPC